ncbi:hypothetical protein Tco_0061535, partial [Tanacetum coccineum]
SILMDKDLEWYEALEDSELKEEALKNKTIMEGLIEEDDDDESQELCEIHELLVCNIRRLEMIKYSFEQDEEYVAIKENEYDDLARTSKDACRAYQEIFCMIDEGWMFVFPDINTAYPLHTIRRIDCLDIIRLYFLCTSKTLLSVLAIWRIHEPDTAYPPD